MSFLAEGKAAQRQQPPDETLKSAFLLCCTNRRQNGANSINSEVLDLASFLELTTALQIQSTPEELETIYHTIDTDMTYERFQTLFYQTLVNLRSDRPTTGTTTTTNGATISIHPDYLRRAAALALTTLTPGTATPESTDKFNRLSQVIRIYNQQNKQLQSSLNEVTHESKLFRLQVEQELSRRNNSNSSDEKEEEDRDGHTVSYFRNHGGVGPKVVAELHRHIAAQETEMHEKQRYINTLLQETRKTAVLHTEQMTSLENLKEEELNSKDVFSQGLHRHVEELENTCLKLEKKLQEETMSKRQLDHDFNEYQEKHADKEVEQKEAWNEQLRINEDTVHRLENELEIRSKSVEALYETNIEYEDQHKIHLQLLENNELLQHQLLDEKKKLEILTKNLRENLETATRQALLSKNEATNLTVQIETYQQEIATFKDKQLSMTAVQIRTQARVDSLEEDKTRLTSAQRNTQEQVVQGTHKIQHVERQLLASEKEGDELRHQLTREKEQNRRTTRELEILKVAHQATMDVNTRREDQQRSLDRDVDRLNKLIQQYEKEKEMTLRDNVSSSSSSSSPTTATTASANATVTNLQLEEIQSLRDNLRTERKRHQEIDSTNVKTINTLTVERRNLEEEFETLTTSYEHDQRKWERERSESKEETVLLQRTLEEQKVTLLKCQQTNDTLLKQEDHLKRKLLLMVEDKKEQTITTMEQLKATESDKNTIEREANDAAQRLHASIVGLQHRLKDTEAALEANARRHDLEVKNGCDAVERAEARARETEVECAKEILQIREETNHQMEKNKKEFLETKKHSDEQHTHAIKTLQKEWTSETNELKALNQEYKIKMETTNKTLVSEREKHRIAFQDYEQEVLVDKANKAKQAQLKYNSDLGKLRATLQQKEELYREDKHALRLETNQINLKCKEALMTVEAQELQLSRCSKTLQTKEAMIQKERTAQDAVVRDKEKKCLALQNEKNVILQQYNENVLEKDRLVAGIEKEKHTIERYRKEQEEQALKMHDMKTKIMTLNNEKQQCQEELLYVTKTTKINATKKEQEMEDLQQLVEKYQDDIKKQRTVTKRIRTQVEEVQGTLEQLQMDKNKLEEIIANEVKKYALLEQKLHARSDTFEEAMERKNNKINELKDYLKQLKKLCREEVHSLGELVRESEAKRRSAESECAQHMERYKALEIEMSKKADELILYEAISKEREDELSQHTIELEAKETSLRKTHQQVEQRLNTSEVQLSDLLVKLNHEKDLNNANKIQMLKDQQMIKNLKIFNNELEILKNQKNDNYNNLVSSMEESNHGISMKEEEYQRQSREELAHEKMKTIRMKSKIVELDDQVLKYKSLYNEMKRKNHDNQHHPPTPLPTSPSSTKSFQKDAAAWEELKLEKERLERKVITLEHQLHVAQETLKREQKEQLVLSTEIELMKRDLYKASIKYENYNIAVEETAVEQRKILLDYQHKLERYSTIENELQETKQLLKMSQEEVMYLKKLSSETQSELKDNNYSRIQERKKTNDTINHLMDEKEELLRNLKKQGNHTTVQDQLRLEQEAMQQEEMKSLQDELETMKRMKLKTDEQNMRYQRDLSMQKEMRSSELDLESSMRHELDDIRADFKSYLSQSKEIVVGNSGGGSELGDYGRTTQEMLRSSGEHSSSSSSSSIVGTTSRTTTFSSEELTQYRRDEEEDILTGVVRESSKFSDDGSTSIRISRRGSIHVHAPPPK